MSIKEQIELQEYVKKYQASLGCAELKRRGRLVREANALIGRLAMRAKEFAGVDYEQYRRSIKALASASARTARREKAYYGA